MPSGPSSQIRSCAASRWWRSRDDGDPEAVGAAYDAGVNTYLAKPVTFLALVKLMKVFTAYWLETAVLPPEQERRVSRLPEHLVLLAVQADEAAHAPVRAALKAIEGTEYEIHWVTTPRAALAALEEHPHDAFLVDRELHDPGHSGLDVARDILAHSPHAPVILLDDHADRETDLAADRGRRLGLPRAPEPGDARAQPALRDHPPARAARGWRSPRSATRSRSRAPTTACGTGTCAPTSCTSRRAGRRCSATRRPRSATRRGEWLGRVHPDDRAGLTQALEGHLSGATQHFESEHRIQHRDGSYRWMLARGIAVRDHNGRATRVVGSQTDVTRPPRRPSSASSTTRCTTR